MTFTIAGPFAFSAPYEEVSTLTSETPSMFTFWIVPELDAMSVSETPSETTVIPFVPLPLAEKLPVGPLNPTTAALYPGLLPTPLLPEDMSKPGSMRTSSVASRPTIESVSISFAVMTSARSPVPRSFTTGADASTVTCSVSAPTSSFMSPMLI